MPAFDEAALRDAVKARLAADRQDPAAANPLLGGFGPTGIAIKGGSALLQALLMKKLADKGHPTAAKALGYGIGAGMGALAARNSQVGKK